MNLNEEEAFEAMSDFLEKYYQRTNSDDIACVLSDIAFLGKKETADPAAWHDWIDSVNKVLNQKNKKRPHLKLTK